MPIPTVNLIPPAFYIRKKVKVAIGVLVAVILVEAGGLFYAFSSQKQAGVELASQQATAQDAVNKVSSTKDQADSALAAVKDLTDRTTFIDNAVNPATGKNAAWAKVFEPIAEYSYPGAVYTSIKPAAGSNMVDMHIRLVARKGMSPIRLVCLYWAGLRRCPAIKAAYPQSFGTSSDTGEGGSLAGSASGVAGPPMPGGLPMPGGPPMARNISSASSLAGPAMEGAAGYNAALAGSPVAMPTATLSDLGGAVVKTGPRMYDVDVKVELMKAVETASLKAASSDSASGLTGAPMPQLQQR